MLKTYHGSCHCGAVAYEADFDLSQGTGKCNCSFCAKVRNWSVHLKPEQLRVLRGEDNLGDYTFGTNQAHHLFCKTCGVRTFSRGNIPEIGGEFRSVAVASLDDVDPAELVEAPVRYMDGRHDNWFNPPAEIRHL